MSSRKADRAYSKKVEELAKVYFEYIDSLPKEMNIIKRGENTREELERLTMKWLLYCERVDYLKYGYKPNIEAFNKYIIDKTQTSSAIVKSGAKRIAPWWERVLANIMLLRHKLNFWK